MKSCNVSVVYQMNMQHARMATSLMAGDILGAEAQTVIALIQEPYVGKGGVPLGFPGGLKCYHGGKKARAAIVTKGIDLLLCPSFSGDDVVTCQTRMGARDLYLVFAYLDINSGIPDELMRLLDSGLTEKAGVVIGGDINAHSTMWGSKETNRRGSWWKS